MKNTTLYDFVFSTERFELIYFKNAKSISSQIFQYFAHPHKQIEHTDSN